MPKPGTPERGTYLTWLFWYQGVFEPVAILSWAGLSHPAVHASAVAATPDAVRGDEVVACIVLKPGQAADEVGDDRRRADDTHGHREGDGIDQEQTEVAPVSGFALGGGERPRARIGHGCPAG